MSIAVSCATATRPARIASTSPAITTRSYAVTGWVASRTIRSMLPPVAAIASATAASDAGVSGRPSTVTACRGSRARLRPGRDPLEVDLSARW